MRRALNTGSPYDVEFKPGASVSLGCAAFNRAGKRGSPAITDELLEDVRLFADQLLDIPGADLFPSGPECRPECVAVVESDVGFAIFLPWESLSHRLEYALEGLIVHRLAIDDDSIKIKYYGIQH